MAPPVVSWGLCPVAVSRATNCCLDTRSCPVPTPENVGFTAGCLTLDDDVSTGVSRKFNSPGRPVAAVSNISSSTSRIAFRLIFIASDVYINESWKTILKYP